eukprot:TRINITY_DN7027_c0_g1_i4.p1 TRINITY_DN7027_c0_g1~~TRINITY_DN7027_c0_g1_i4.p1  ORF type:complete len:423 (+),score=22.27 TRINITY_DN7027_c0_g1_i4:116-1384(+)
MYVAWCNEWCYKQGIAEGLHQTIWQMCRDVGFLMIRFRTAARYLTWQRNHYQSQPHLLITCGRYMEPILQGLTDGGRGCDPLEIVVLSESRDTFPCALGWTRGKEYHITVLRKFALDTLKALLVSYSEKIREATSPKAVKKHTQGETSSSSQNPLSRGTARHTQGETLSSSQILSSSPRTAARHTQGTILSSSQVPSSSPGMAPTQTVASSSSQSFSSSPETAPHTQGTTSNSSQIPSSSPRTAARHTQVKTLSSSQVPSSSPGMAPHTQGKASSSLQSFSSSPGTVPHTQGTTSSSLQIPPLSAGMASSRLARKNLQFDNTTAHDSDPRSVDHHTEPAGLNFNPGLQYSIADHHFGARAYLQFHEDSLCQRQKDLLSQGLISGGTTKFDLSLYLMKAIQDRFFASRLAALLTAAMPDEYTD